MKKLTALILVLGILVGLCAGAFAAPADTVLRIESRYHTNPLYDGIRSSDPTLHHRAKTLLTSEEPEYLDSIFAGSEILRDAMTARQDVCSVYIRTSDYSEERLYEIIDDMILYAMIHTGEPTEGDYLMWQLDAWAAGAEGYIEDGMGYITFTYELFYYTTAQQEAQVDAKVEELVSELGLSGKGEYEALRAIYDYICDNVVYDYEHVEDDSYVLQYTAYGALIDGTAVCQGYAVLLYRLALEAGVDCHLIPGIGAGGPHAWNIAQIEELYYDLDATWDAGTTDYEYFLRCDANFGDHQRDEVFDSPEFHELYPMSDKDYVLPCDHTYNGDVHPATCTEDGYTVYTCTKCGDSYTADRVSATGHSYGEWTESKAPTCTTDGKEERVCVHCGDRQTQSISAKGHDYEDGRCTVCGRELDTGVTVPEAPSILSCYSKLQTSVKVTWGLVEGAEGYELWRGTSPEEDGSWLRAKTISSASTDRYTNQGLTVGTTYYYKVRAFVTAADGTRIYSDFSEVEHMPAAVVFDGPYSNATFRIRLRWLEIGGAHGYQIWRQNADGSFSIAKTLGDRGNVLTNDQSGTTAYSNTGLTAGENYTYKMRAFWIAEDGRKIFGAFSDEYTVAVMPETPAVTVTCPKAERIKVAWDSVNGAAGYQIWISDTADGTYKIAKSVTDPAATSATLYGMDSGKTYYVKVRAYTDVDGKKTFGGYSRTVSVTVS